MKRALICYDLKNVTPDDNIRVKTALTSDGFKSRHMALNLNSLFPKYFFAKLPDTTLLVDIIDQNLTPQDIGDFVVETIKSVGAIPQNVFVAFITESFIWNG